MACLPLGVALDVVHESGRFGEHFEDFQGGPRHRGRKGVAEQVRPRALPQERHHLLGPRGVAAGRAPKSFAQSGVDDDPARCHLVLHPTVLHGALG